MVVDGSIEDGMHAIPAGQRVNVIVCRPPFTWIP